VLGRYEAVRSSLDLGPDRALVVPRSRVAYVPSAALLVRRAAAGAGFDEDLHAAEDVEFELALHAAGWRMRFEPAARVAHDHRTTRGAWALRKAFYGTGAAPLALRHPGAVPPMVLSPTSAAVGALLLLARPWSAPAAVAVGAVGAGRLAGRLAVERPRRTAARLVALGARRGAGPDRRRGEPALLAGVAPGVRAVAAGAAHRGGRGAGRGGARLVAPPRARPPRPPRPARPPRRAPRRRPRLRRRPVVGRAAAPHDGPAAARDRPGRRPSVLVRKGEIRRPKRPP
jgi:hypothetical protein